MGLIFRPIIGIVLNGGVLYLLTRLVEGVSYTGGIKFFVLGGLVVGVINFLIKPLIKVLALPFTIITGGLFTIVINMGTLWFLSYLLGVLQFQDVSLAFSSFSNYAIGAVVFGIINWGAHLIVK